MPSPSRRSVEMSDAASHRSLNLFSDIFASGDHHALSPEVPEFTVEEIEAAQKVLNAALVFVKTHPSASKARASSTGARQRPISVQFAGRPLSGLGPGGSHSIASGLASRASIAVVESVPEPDVIETADGSCYEVVDVESQLAPARLKRIPKRNAKLNPKITNKLAMFSLVWQLVNVGLLYLLSVNTKASSSATNTTAVRFGIVVVCVFEFVHILVMFGVAIKLLKQVMHRTVTFAFLAQSWIATTVVFAGIYTLM